MFRAMALKELRETRGIALLALAAYGLLLWCQMAQVLKWRPQTMPFVDDGFLPGYIWVSGGLAIALGMRQTLGESIAGTYLFLFHRPAIRRWLIGAKLLVGLAAYLLCALLPVVIYGVLAATPGAHSSPFFWEMTIPTLVTCLTMTVLYFGAFLSGIRQGRWFYSKLFPLAGAGLMAFASAALHSDFSRGAVASLAPILLTDALLVASILFVARTRDYS
jgi:hypothetical protein